MIVIDPKPLEAIQNLETSILERVSEKIIPIKGKFGDDEVFRNLEMALKVNNRTRYFERQETAKIWSKKTKAQAKRQGLLK